MIIKKIFNIVLMVMFCVPFCPGHVSARQTILNGSAGVGYEYWDRKYEEQNADEPFFVAVDEDRRDYTARVEFELQSQGIHDTLSLRYSPVFLYDDLNFTTDVDHYFTVEGERSFTRDWQVSIADAYVFSNDPARYTTPFSDTGYTGEMDTETEQTGETPEITYNYGRRRYWSNNLNAETSYTYAEESEVRLGYTFRVLRNDSADDELGPGYDEYDRHEFRGRLSNRFTPAISSTFDLRYVKGLFEDAEEVPGDGDNVTPSQDLEEYRGDLGIDYYQSANNSFSTVYGYLGARYEDERRDNDVHELTFGWEHSFDQHTRLNLEAGPSYIDIEGLDGEWGYNALLDFTKSYQHGNISAGVEKRYAPRNFTGGDDTGLADTTNVNLNALYQLTQDFSVTILGRYRYEDILDPVGNYYLAGLGGEDQLDEQDVGDVTYSRESFSVGAGLEYTFLRWFTASLRYLYLQQDGDLDQDTFEDYQIIFQISASKELWRK